jgi:hypothetical protein
VLEHLKSSTVMAVSAVVSVIMILCGNSNWYLLLRIQGTERCVANKSHQKILVNPCSGSDVGEDGGLDQKENRVDGDQSEVEGEGGVGGRGEICCGR